MRNGHHTSSNPVSFGQRCLGRALVVATLAASASLCWAQDDASAPALPPFSLQGFGTLGLTRTNDDRIQFVRDLSQPKGAGTHWTPKVDSLLGLQANYRLGERTEAVAQVISRYHTNDSYDAELAWAFVRHDVSPDFSVRAGRLGTEFYMLGDSRLIGYANLTVRPPPDFYGSLVFSYIDGADVSGTLALATGLLKGKVFAGQSREKPPYAGPVQWDLRGSPLLGGYLDYQNGPWQMRFSLVQVKFNQDQPIDTHLQANGDPLAGTPYLALLPEMGMNGKRARFASLGSVFDQGPLNIQFMLNQINYDSPAYADSRGSYLLGAYRLGAITPYVGVSRNHTDAPALPRHPIPGVDVVTNMLVSQTYIDQRTFTLGGRWDVQKNVALKAQVDTIRGKPASVFLFKDNQPGWDGRMVVFSLALDFVF